MYLTQESIDVERAAVNGSQSLAAKWLNNNTDARIRRRLPGIVGWLYTEFKGIQKGLSREISNERLRSPECFGQGKSLRELKSIILGEHGRFVPGYRSSSWCLIRHEFSALVDALGVDAAELGRQWVAARVLALSVDHADELRSGAFCYAGPKHGCQHRLYHPLVSQPRAVRDAVLLHGGLPYQYDVKSAFPVLLAQVLGAEPLPTLRKLVADPDDFRKSLAFSLGVSVPQVKGILSALLFGARSTGDYYEMAITDLLGAEYEGHGELLWHRFKSHPLVRGLVADYAEVRRVVHRWIDDNPSLPYHALPRGKWLYYVCEAAEGKVRGAMADFLAERGNRVFHIHDCIATDADLTENVLVQVIEDRTGYLVRLSKSEYKLDSAAY
jgi:hypothetical protein